MLCAVFEEANSQLAVPVATPVICGSASLLWWTLISLESLVKLNSFFLEFSWPWCVTTAAGEWLAVMSLLLCQPVTQGKARPWGTAPVAFLP